MEINNCLKLTFLSILLSITFVSISCAAIVERTTAGQWNMPTTWYIDGVVCNCIPSAADSVVIANNPVIINSNDTLNISGLTIQSTGALIINATSGLNVSGSHGILNYGDITCDGYLNVESQGNYPIENLGYMTVAGYCDVTSDTRIYSNGELFIEPFGTMKLDSIDDIGIFVGSSGTLTNFGQLITTFTANHSISISGLFENQNDLIIANSQTSGIYISSLGSFNNDNNISISNCGTHGIWNFGQLTSHDSITINNVTNNAIFNSNTIDNDGILSIINSQYGIRNSSVFNNTGTIEIDSSSIYGIYCTASFNNNGIIAIKNADAPGIFMSGSTFTNTDSISMHNLVGHGMNCLNSTVNSTSKIDIDECDDGIIVNGSNFTNDGTINLTNISGYGINTSTTGVFDTQIELYESSDLGIYNDGQFNNQGCARMKTYSKIINGGVFSNASVWDHYGSGTSVNLNTITNSGILIDPHNDITGLVTSNVGLIHTTIPGEHCEGDVVANVFAGIGPSITMGTTVYGDSDKTIIAGIYNNVSHQWTPNANAAYLDTFYLTATKTPCTSVDVMFFMENQIKPIWYADADNDGFGDGSNTICSYAQPSGFVLDYTDCDDSDATIFPNAPELCDGKDNDCNGMAETAIMTWNGLGDGMSWDDKYNWDGEHLPLTCQVIHIFTPSNVIIGNSVTAYGKQLNAVAGVTLDIVAGGVLLLDGQNTHPPLINSGLINNSGYISVSDALGDAVQNAGFILNLDTLLINNSSSKGVNNSGLGVINNQGYIGAFGVINSDVIYNEGEITNTTDGTLSLVNNPIMTTAIFNVSTAGSVAKITNNGMIEISGAEYGIKQSMTSNPILNASQGIINISNCVQSGISDGSIDNNGEININGVGGSGLDDVDFTNTNVISLNGCAQSGIYLRGIQNNSGDFVISNCGIGIDQVNSLFINSGIINIDTSATHGMRIDATSTFQNNNELEIHVATLNGVDLNGTLTNQGTIDISQNILQNGIEMIGTSALTNQNAGIIDIESVDSTLILITGGDLVNNGKIYLNNAGRDGIDTHGAALANNIGEVKIGNGISGKGITGTSTMFNNLGTGLLTGEGVIKGSILNNLGTMSPGNSPGKFIIEGDYTHGTGSYYCDIDGTNGVTVPDGHDQIEVGADIYLSGILDLVFAPGYEMCPGDEFVIMRSVGGVVNGSFTTVNAPSNWCLQIEYGLQEVKVIRPGPPISNWIGTFNSDWFEPNNWNEGCVPGPMSQVFIHPSPNNPKIENKNGVVDEVTLNPFTVLTIGTGFKLDITD